MKPSIQANLVVTSRNVLQSAEAFLIPYKEIFKFVEDIVNVSCLTRVEEWINSYRIPFSCVVTGVDSTNKRSYNFYLYTPTNCC